METLSNLNHRQQALLRHLLYHGEGLTLDQLAQLLEISRNAVAQHMPALEGWRYVESTLLPSGGGRPSRAYQLTDAGKALFPKQYGLFSTMMLKTLTTKLEGKELENLLAAIGRDIADSFKERVAKSEDKMEEVRRIMEEVGYETVKSTTASDPSEIVAKNCVFHDLAKENNAVCQLDLALIASLLDADIEQTECMAKGGESCRFCVAKTHTKGPKIYPK